MSFFVSFGFGRALKQMGSKPKEKGSPIEAGCGKTFAAKKFEWSIRERFGVFQGECRYAESTGDKGFLNGLLAKQQSPP